jgi:hypothetical protein
MSTRAIFDAAGHVRDWYEYGYHPSVYEQLLATLMAHDILPEPRVMGFTRREWGWFPWWMVFVGVVVMLAGVMALVVIIFR